MKIFALSLLLICRIATAGVAQNRRPDLIIIPDGYVGWIQVNYGVKGAPALPNWKGSRLHKFGRDAEIRTSSPTTDGWAKDKYFYSTQKGWKQLLQTTNGGNGMVWGKPQAVAKSLMLMPRARKSKFTRPKLSPLSSEHGGNFTIRR